MDWATIKELLEIVELSRGHPSLKSINDAAIAELERIANPPVEEWEEEPEEKEPDNE